MAGTLVQCDESIMAIIEKIDKERGHTYITERLDTETCLIAPEKIAELERLVKEVSFATVKSRCYGS
jgi:hypothetical protein